MSDYARIEKAIIFINESALSQPKLDDIAKHLHLSPDHLQRLFSRWVGVSPKKYLQILTVKRAKYLLNQNSSLLDVSHSLGLSSGSRLYDHFIKLEAVTPGEHKQRGNGVLIEYAIHSSPFGKIFIAATMRGICKLSFLYGHDIEEQLLYLKTKWPLATLQKNTEKLLPLVTALFNPTKKLNSPLSLHVSGTNFQIHVWKALLRISPGSVCSYTQIATAIGRPRAARAVGTAMGENPAAFIIPCHRVIQQSGKLGGYRWGETRLHAIHAWETARREALAD